MKNTSSLGKHKGAKTPKRAAVGPTPGVDPEKLVVAAMAIAEVDPYVEFCCNALDNMRAYQEKAFFDAILNPHNGHYAWYSDHVSGTPTSKEVNQRVLGLLLCAQLAREGFMPEGWMLNK